MASNRLKNKPDRDGSTPLPTSQEKQGRRSKWLLAVFSVFIVLFMVSVILFLNSCLSERAEAQVFDRLAELAGRNERTGKAPEKESSPLTESAKTQESGNPSEGSKENGEDEETEPSLPPDVKEQDEAPDDMTIRLRNLYERNNDFCGWLSIEDTNINYPVMFTPDEPEYYLRRDFDGNASNSGVPFLGEGCDLISDNIIIYGHNIKTEPILFSAA